MQGIVATDCWKLVKYHVAKTHKMKDMTINDFSDILAKRLIDNDMSNGPKPVTRGNLKRPRHTLVLEVDFSHKPVHLPRKNGKTKQFRCRWCATFDGIQTSFTSFKCSECNVGLCIGSNRPGARDCFNKHMVASAADLATLTSTAKKRRSISALHRAKLNII